MLADCCAAAEPVSPFTSKDTATSSITGRYTDVEDACHVDPTVLGTNLKVAVRACFNCETGKRYAVKTICKADSSVKCGGLMHKIMLLRGS